MTRSKSILASILTVLVVAAFSTPAAANDLSLMEPSEADGSQPPIGNVYGFITPRSPMRDSSGNDLWNTINSQYNEPRSSTYLHKGVDISSGPVTCATDCYGRSIFAVMSGVVMAADTYAGYGTNHRIKHTVNVNGTNYSYSTLYAHLYSKTNWSAGASVSATSQVGTSGQTGLGCGTSSTTHCVHLHLDFESVSSTNSGGKPRKYPTAFFYTPVNSTWGTNSTFITKSSQSVNTACFRFTVASNFTATYQNPELYYLTSSGTWLATTWTSQSGDIYCKDLAALPNATRGSTVKYYLKAWSNGWDGTNFHPANRPWRHDCCAPKDAPFIFTIQ